MGERYLPQEYLTSQHQVPVRKGIHVAGAGDNSFLGWVASHHVRIISMLVGYSVQARVFALGLRPTEKCCLNVGKTNSMLFV